MSGAMYRGTVSLVLFDVDGVLTDGLLQVTADGEFMKSFHVHDGVAIALLRAHGIRTGVLSGRHSDALAWRARQLGVDVVGDRLRRQGCRLCGYQGAISNRGSRDRVCRR